MDGVDDAVGMRRSKFLSPTALRLRYSAYAIRVSHLGTPILGPCVQTIHCVCSVWPSKAGGLHVRR